MFLAGLVDLLIGHELVSNIRLSEVHGGELLVHVDVLGLEVSADELLQLALELPTFEGFSVLDLVLLDVGVAAHHTKHNGQEEVSFAVSIATLPLEHKHLVDVNFLASLRVL